jgi:hypothetical protein
LAPEEPGLSIATVAIDQGASGTVRSHPRTGLRIVAFAATFCLLQADNEVLARLGALDRRDADIGRADYDRVTGLNHGGKPVSFRACFM